MKVLESYWWFCDFGAYRRIVHALGLICPLLLAWLGLVWMWHHTPVVIGDVVTGLCCWPIVGLVWKLHRSPVRA